MELISTAGEETAIEEGAAVSASAPVKLFEGLVPPESAGPKEKKEKKKKRSGALRRTVRRSAAGSRGEAPAAEPAEVQRC